jgi:hypothetical protein
MVACAGDRVDGAHGEFGGFVGAEGFGEILDCFFGVESYWREQVRLYAKGDVSELGASLPCKSTNISRDESALLLASS